MACRKKTDSRRTIRISKRPEEAVAFERSILAYSREHRLFPPDTAVVVAVSGGADSLCLLYVLRALADRLAVRLHVAHIHHALRGPGADDDASFVAAVAVALGVPCSVEHVDVPAGRQRGESVEAAARRLRYDALRSVASREGASRIAVAHTRDDQAETVLLHVIRGAGIEGLAAMRPLSGMLARPLLATPRESVERFNQSLALTPRHDATNADTRYRRNAIRHELLPALAAYNPRVKEALARMASTLAGDEDYLRAEARSALARLRLPDQSDRLRLDRPPLAALHPGLRAHVLRCAIEEIVGSLDGFSHAHVRALDDLVISDRAGRLGQLPKQLIATAAGGAVWLQRAPAPISLSPVQEPLAVDLLLPGQAIFGPWTVEAALVSPEDDQPAQEMGRGWTAILDREAVYLPLQVRGRRPGDRIERPGRHDHRKLQDIFVDAKTPRQERDAIPIVVDRRGIIWVAGHAQDGRTVAGLSARNRIWLSARRTDHHSIEG